MSDGMPLPGVVVIGRGTASAPPDLVRVDLAAEAAAESVQHALDHATVGLSRMRSALLDGGVQVDDLRTTETTLREDHGPRGDRPLRYVARLGLSAKVRDVARAGAVVQNALAEGGDTARLGGLYFELSDSTEQFTAARAAAFADALAKARQYASLAGRELGEVISVDESAGGPAPLPRRQAVAFAAADFPVDGGQQEIVATVTLHWSWA
ncbi:MAG: SIMPL domain-containing protein [Jiangellaceae bacterium]|nr:SIMPL domain-containing protein [Jiangellaceae bacterium]